MKNAFTRNKSMLFVFTLFSFVLMVSTCGKEDDLLGDFDENGLPILEENFILDESRLFLNFVVSQEKYDEFIANDIDFNLVSSKVYDHFKDDFDFIFIFADEDEHPAGASYGRTVTVKGDIEGLGSNLFNNSVFYGLGFGNEETRLQSIIYMPLVNYIRAGPFLHEIAHNWANKGFIQTTVGGHWGYSSAGGQLGGFDELVNLGAGRYLGRFNGNDNFGVNANGGNSLPYSNIELYLMGMIPASELASIQVAENPQNVQEEPGVFMADNITTYTAEYLIAEHGERFPSFNNSQREFKAISVIVSTSPISEERKELAIAHLNNFTKQGEPSDDWSHVYNFWEATNSLGVIDAGIENSSLK